MSRVTNYRGDITRDALLMGQAQWRFYPDNTDKDTCLAAAVLKWSEAKLSIVVEILIRGETGFLVPGVERCRTDNVREARTRFRAANIGAFYYRLEMEKWKAKAESQSAAPQLPDGALVLQPRTEYAYDREAGSTYPATHPNIPAGVKFWWPDCDIGYGPLTVSEYVKVMVDMATDEPDEPPAFNNEPEQHDATNGV